MTIVWILTGINVVVCILSTINALKVQEVWHTGIPKEKGRYACLVRDKKCILDKYVILEWHDDSIEWGGWFRPEHKGEYEVLGWTFIGDCPYGQINFPLNKLKARQKEEEDEL